MFTTLFSVSLFIALIRSVVAQSGFQIDTPSLVQCESTQITWSSTSSPPYDLLVVSAQDVCGEALEDLGNQTSTTLTWDVNFPSGTQLVLSIQDSVGNEAWSGTITVGNSNDTSCLASTPSASTSTISGTHLTVPPSATSSSPTSSAFNPASTTNTSLAPTSGAFSTRPFSAVNLLGSVILAVVMFAL